MGDYIDRTKLLADINNGIKAGNYEEGYEQYQNINNIDDIIETIKYSDKADVIERSKVDKIEKLCKEQTLRGLGIVPSDKILDIIKEH